MLLSFRLNFLLLVLIAITFFILFLVSVILFEDLLQVNSFIPKADEQDSSPSFWDAEACTPEAEIALKRRIQLVKNQCRKYDLRKLEPPTPQYSYFFLNQKKRLAWCPVYKAGSTSWLHNMLLIAGVSEAQLSNPPKQLSIWAREIYGEPEPMDLENSLKLLIVRHPFERLLSAYRDKLSNASIGAEHGTGHFYAKYGKFIVKKFRKNEFIEQKEPTFEEFVKYLIETKFVHYDDHWLPEFYTCTPCLVQYNFIGKVETLNRDQNCIIQATNLSSILKPKWMHRTHPVSKVDRKNLSHQYFSQLTKSQIRNLYEKYVWDFILFDYSIMPYLGFGRNE